MIAIFLRHAVPAGAVLAACVLGSLCAAPRSDAGEELPQQHDWQAELRSYLMTLQPADFVVSDHTFHRPDEYQQQGADRIYRDWIVLGHLGREPTTAGLRAEPHHFTLERIEGERIRIYPEPAAIAWWVQFDFPGNPYAHSQSAMRRALVIAIVDMIMLETAQRADPRNLKADFLAANLGTWAYTFHHCHQLLPPKSQHAYRQGMLHYSFRRCSETMTSTKTSTANSGSPGAAIGPFRSKRCRTWETRVRCRWQRRAGRRIARNVLDCQNRRRCPRASARQMELRHLGQSRTLAHAPSLRAGC